VNIFAVIVPLPSQNKKPNWKRGEMVLPTMENKLNKKLLAKEMKAWIETQIEKNKFPCAKCKHFELAHIKGLCIACHDIESDLHRESNINCYHQYSKMDNLSLIEWIAEQNEEQKRA
jgi:hypothetical protein